MTPRGYFVPQGFVGHVGSGTMLFSTERDYLEFLEELENSNCLISGMPEESHFSIRLEPVSPF